MSLHKMLQLTTVALLVVSAAAHAGPNEGVVLTPHGNVHCVETYGDICSSIWSQPPAACEETDPNACPQPSTGVEWFLAVAAGEQELSLATIVFGLGEYDPYDCYLSAFGPCFADLGPIEVPSSGWPAPHTGTAVSWAPNCLYGMLVPVYYFGFYVYASDGVPGGPVPLGDFYPGLSAAVVSCGDPPEEDPVEAFGVMGVGDDPGLRVCPGPPVSTSPVTWGQIKTIYR